MKRFRHAAALAFLTASLANLCLPRPASCSWERVNEFYGTMTITFEVDHQTVPDIFILKYKYKGDRSIFFMESAIKQRPNVRVREV